MPDKIVIACQSCGYLIKDIANAFAEVGYSVTIMASSNCLSGMKKSLSEDIATSTVIAYDKSSSIKRIWTWAICAIQMWWKILYHHRGEQVLFVSNPPFGPLLPLLLGNRFSLLIWDIYPDVLVNQHVVSKNHFIVRWWQKANRKVFDRASKIYTLSEGMKRSLYQYATPVKIAVAPLWPDNRNLHKIEKGDNFFIKKNHLEGKFIVMYSGNLGNTHRMDVLLDVAKRIVDDDIAFVLIGEGGKKKMINERIKNEKINNVLLLPYQPYDFLSHSLSAADIAVVTLDTESSAMSVPSKTFNMMSLGSPLLCIASPNSELGNIVRKYDVGKMFLPEDVDGIKDYILQVKNDSRLRERYSQNSLNASKNFTSENAKIFVEKE